MYIAANDCNQWTETIQNAVNLPKIERSLQKGIIVPNEKDRRNLGQKNAWEQFCHLNDIFPRYRIVSIDKLAIADDDEGSYRDKATRIVQNPRSLLLMGGAGRGKTHFMFAVLRAMFDANLMHIGDVRYFDNIELDRRIQEEVRRYKSAKDFIETISSVPILIIDDFGTDTGTQRHERDFYEIFNKRFGRNLITFLSTNLTLKDIFALYGERIASRLQDCVGIEFNGPDLRGKRI